jgi:uncharacterized protein (TIGR00725 family)
MSGPDRPPQVSVIGSARAGDEIAALAEEVGRLLAEAGVTIVCGGGPGVMEAASRGAAGAGGIVVGIVPSAEPADANSHCTYIVASGIGQARNLAVVASGAVVVAVGGEWGTLSEIALARRLGRPVVALKSWAVTGFGAMKDAPGIEVAEDPESAVKAALTALEAETSD